MKTITELEAMTDDELNKSLAGLLGVQPELVDWMAYKDDGATGSCCMSGRTEREVQDWLDKLPAGSWAKDYKPKPLYRWPDYCRELNTCAAVEGRLPPTKLYDYDLHLRMANASSARTSDFEAHLDDYVWSRTARQRTIALILTLQKQ